MRLSVACARCGTRFPDRSSAESVREVVGEVAQEGGLLDRSTWWVMGFGLLAGAMAWVARAGGMRTTAVVLGGLAVLCVGAIAFFWVSNTGFSLLMGLVYLLRVCPSCFLGRLAPAVDFPARFPRRIGQHLRTDGEAAPPSNWVTRLGFGLEGALQSLGFEVVASSELRTLVNPRSLRASPQGLDPEAREQLRAAGVEGVFVGSVEKQKGILFDAYTLELQLQSADTGGAVWAGEIRAWDVGPEGAGPALLEKLKQRLAGALASR